MGRREIETKDPKRSITALSELEVILFERIQTAKQVSHFVDI